MCSACITISPRASNSAVDASRRSLMFAECAERISTAPISSQTARSAPVSTCSSTGSIDRRHRSRQPTCCTRIVPVSSTSPVQPGGTSSVDSGSSTTAGPSSACPAAGSRAAPRARRCSPSIVASRADALHVRSLVVAAGELDVDAGRGRGHPDRDELELLLGVAVAVALLVLGLERLAQLVGLGARGARDRRARTPGRGSAARRRRGARRRARASPRGRARRARSTSLRDRLRGQLVAAQQDAPLHVAPARRDDEPERREDSRGARAQDRVDPELVGDLRGVQPAGATEREQRVAARVDSALHGHDPQRADHLGVGDPADALGALVQRRGRAAPRVADRALSAASRSSSTPPPSGASADR